MELTLVFWLLVLTAFIGLLLLIYERKTRRIGRQYDAFPLTIIALLIWILAYAVELASIDRRIMLLFADIQFIGIGAVPSLVFLSIRQFLGRPGLRSRFKVVAGIIPVLTIVLAFTDPWLGLLRDSAAVVRNHGMIQLDVSYGIWHNAVFVPYQYAFYFAAFFILVDAGIRSSRIFRLRLFTFAAGLALPMIGGLLYVMDVSPFDVFNPTSVLIMFSFVTFGLVMLQHHQRDVVPVARNQVIETLEEGIVVLDLDDRIVEYNTSAASIFVDLNDGALGKDFVKRLGDDDAFLALARGIDDSGVGFTLDGPSGLRSYIGRSAPVVGVDGTRIGRLITISDITEHLPSQTEDDGLMARPEFFRVVGSEAAEAARTGRPFHLAVLAIPEDSPSEAVASLSRVLRDRLRDSEHASFTGSGRFFLSFPEIDKDRVLLRARELSQILASYSGKLRIGIVGLREGREESAEELAVRAVRTAGGHRVGIAYAR